MFIIETLCFIRGRHLILKYYLWQDYINKAPVILHGNLQWESHAPYGPPTSVTWLQLKLKQTNTGVSNSLAAERTWLCALFTCDISQGSPTLHASETGDFVELILLYVKFLFQRVNPPLLWEIICRGVPRIFQLCKAIFSHFLPARFLSSCMWVRPVCSWPSVLLSASVKSIIWYMTPYCLVDGNCDFERTSFLHVLYWSFPGRFSHHTKTACCICLACTAFYPQICDLSPFFYYRIFRFCYSCLLIVESG